MGLPLRGASARLSADERHINGGAAGDWRGCTADQCCETGWSAVQARPAAAGDPLCSRPGCWMRAASASIGQGNRHRADFSSVESAEDEHQDGEDHLARAGQYRLGEVLATPGVGDGIYDREGSSRAPVHAYVQDHAQQGRRSPEELQVSWVGNDGTFSSPATIALQRARRPPSWSNVESVRRKASTRRFSVAP